MSNIQITPPALHPGNIPRADWGYSFASGDSPLGTGPLVNTRHVQENHACDGASWLRTLSNSRRPWNQYSATQMWLIDAQVMQQHIIPSSADLEGANGDFVEVDGGEDGKDPSDMMEIV